MTSNITSLKFRSITTTLAVSMLSLTLFILLTTGSLQLYFTFQAQRETVAAAQQTIAHDAAAKVSEFIADKFHHLEIESVAHTGDLTSVHKDERTLVLEKLLGFDPAFRQVALLDPEKNELTIASRLSSAESFIITASTKNDLMKTVREGKQYISPVYVDEKTSEPLIIIAVPVMDVFDEFKESLAAEVNLKFMWDLVGNIQVGQTGKAYVVDKQGDLIAFGDISRVLKGENVRALKEVHEFIEDEEEDVTSRTEVTTGVDGTAVVSSYVPLGSPDWAMVVEMPLFEAYRPIFEQLSIAAVIVIVTIIFTISISIYISRQITSPIIALRNTAEAITHGRLDTPISVKETNEIGALGTAFNVMLLKLRNYQQNLEQEVAEKTKSLSQQLEKITEQNQLLEDSKKAMLNVLEDEKELEELLKREKENVEKKVEERTRELRELQSRLEASIQSLHLGFIMTDAQGNIITINGAARHILLGNLLHSEEITLENLDKQLGSGINLKALAAKSIGEKSTVEAKEIAFGSKFLSISISPIINLEEQFRVIGSVIVITDISEARMLQRAKDEFFSIASHELRTPVTAIRGNTSLIKDYYFEKLPDKNFQEMISDMHSASIRLLELVNDFLDTSRLEQGKIIFKKETFDIEEVITDQIAEIEHLAIDKQIRITLERSKSPLPNVFADTNRTRQVITNLLGNAIKFTEKGEIRIYSRVIDSQIAISVADTGKGISEQGKNLLFHKFQQAGDNIFTRDTTRGTGLGLYIARLLVNGMGGQIILEKSEENKGSTFTFTLPIAQQNQLKK